ncbi:hypothetical protein PUNSTDRAFT_136803 [Punctularia strigosozonata HHB-11173 SS5]|uniref:uncharacterized protein n=1 Tax=Punctularia strigosozonata (strain HHB-11173) TaxID=741275 RepID=UPI00044179F3|nr:uncharacterized protein PUNSTDRAFT_136803 [Punctularia strigosozonata HHB-11173 SS5]EIN06008.1 hypothetical protein PUNSTDRAFT_136803 [Punctularia strigosozonata HHB-11173 SS5]
MQKVAGVTYVTYTDDMIKKLNKDNWSKPEPYPTSDLLSSPFSNNSAHLALLASSSSSPPYLTYFTYLHLTPASGHHVLV